MTARLLSRSLLALLALGVLASCSTSTLSGIRYGENPQVLNVSSYDPKERQRAGEGFTPDDLGAMRRSGAHGLIARTSKGYDIDSKASRFLAAADREGMLLGAYHFVLPNIDATRQAELFVHRVGEIARSRNLRNRQILMVGDFDSKLPVHQMTRFILRMHQLTGRYPVVYLENSDTIKTALRTAHPTAKRILRECPYWMALYGHEDTGNSRYSSPHPLTPHPLTASARPATGPLQATCPRRSRLRAPRPLRPRPPRAVWKQPGRRRGGRRVASSGK